MSFSKSRAVSQQPTNSPSTACGGCGLERPPPPILGMTVPLLGRAERSIPEARRGAPWARGIDGESASPPNPGVGCCGLHRDLSVPGEHGAGGLVGTEIINTFD
jgi:hypothetical protein